MFKLIIKKTCIIFIFFLCSCNFSFANINELMNEPLQKTTLRTGCSCEYRMNSININWWDNFTDLHVKEYIYKALEKNHDVKKAALKSQEYREMVNVTMAQEFPILTFAPTFARVKTANSQIFDIATPQLRTNIYAMPFLSAYEADIFLKNHDKTQSSKKQYEAAEYEEKASDIAIASDVASLYINILKSDKLIENATKINNIRTKILELTNLQYKEGLASVYDVTYTDKQKTLSQISLNDLKKQRQILLHQMFVYIDECPSDENVLERGNLDELDFRGIIPESISSENVVMRPDLMKAEAELKKAKIDVKIARKEFLPSIPIIGVAGYNSLFLSRLFDWQNIFALVGVAAVQKFYTGGKLTANLRIKKIQYEQLFENYKQADLKAIQEVNDSLCMIWFDTKTDKDNEKKLNLEKKNYYMNTLKYKEGIMSYLDLIKFQENLLSVQSEKDMSKSQKLIDYITLYKAMGSKL